MSKKLHFAYLIGDGTGREYKIALYRLFEKLGILYDVEEITDFRLSNGELDPNVISTFQKYKYSLKGSTETPTGAGARSINVALRQVLDLFVNVRHISYFPGVPAPTKHPELLDCVVFRENSEDVYAGIEFAAASPEAEQLRRFLIQSLGVKAEALPNANTAFGLKPMSIEASERVARFALDYMLRVGRKHLGIAHKGNIMKFTEGMFKNVALNIAKQFSGVWGEEINIPEQGDLQLLVSSVICDDAFQQTLLYPNKYDGILTTNLNGDYLSDALAAQVGGVTLAAGANICDDHGMFEPVGGTGKSIAGRGVCNPTPIFLATAMMLDYAGFPEKAMQIRAGLAGVFEKGDGTFDIVKNNPMTTSEFTEAVIENALATEVVA